MRILRIETKNVLSLPDGAIDFPLHAVVVGANDSGKSCLYRLVILMAGWSADSLASLVRRDAEGSKGGVDRHGGTPNGKGRSGWFRSVMRSVLPGA